MNEITLTIIASAATITIVTLILVVLLLWVKTKLTPSGTVKIDINGGNKILDVAPGNSLMGALAEEKIFLPSACGGKAVQSQSSRGWREYPPDRNRILQQKADQGQLETRLPGQG